MRSTRFLRFATAAVLVIVAPMHVRAQGGLEEVVAGLNWREIGPAVMGGRIVDLAVVESNPAIFYVGTATGGLWKTTNHGTSWKPLFDDQPTASIGAVTLAPSNANVVWVGTGEPQNRQSSPWGAGVFKSLDAGRTWQFMGLPETRHVGRIVIHPRNPDIVYVAAVGHLWGPNEERGVFKTTDGGQTWTKALYVDANTGAIDLVMDPGDPETLFAAMYQRRRTAFGFNGGGAGGGIYRTLNGGTSWRKLETGLPPAPVGRIGLDVFRGDGNLVYAVVEAHQPKRGIYRSTDRGETWEQVSDHNPRPMYFSLIRVDPSNAQRVYLGGVDLSISDDGGRTWNDDAASAVHSDHHALWVDPSNPNHVIMGSDGGVSVSFDAGGSWRMYDNLPIGQFYEIGLDMRRPYMVCGGLQDNGSWCGPSRTLSSLGIRNSDWFNVWGGDGFYVQLDPNDPTVLFAESQNGFIGRVDLATMERLFIRPQPPESAEGDDDADNDYRWNWNSPIVMSVHDPATLYVGANKVVKTADRGITWQEISLDLTKAIDRATLEIMGATLSADVLSRNDGVSSYGNITTLSESPVDPNVLYVGTDDGNVQMTRDGGATWTDLTSRFRDVPARTYVSRVVASAHDVNTAYVTFDGHYGDDYRPHVYVSTNGGGSFRRIVQGLPDWSVNVVAEHPRSRNLLFAGNEIGVYFSIDGGATWARLKNNMPTVPVDDIKIHSRENDLVVGTHGRSIWIVDDIAPLEQLSTEMMASAAYLFPSRGAMTYNEYSPQGWTPAQYEAENPPYGARIRYYVGAGRGLTADGNGSNGSEERSPDSVTVTITDASGGAVRELKGPANPGINEIVWDLRLAPPYEPEENEGGFFGRPRGPRVLPGEYTASVTVGGATARGAVPVFGDHRIEVARADLEARQEVLMQIYHLAKPLFDAGQAAQRLTSQLEEAQTLLRESGSAPDTLRAEARELSRLAGAVRRDLGRVRGGGRRTFSFLEGWTAPPTPQQRRTVDEAWDDATDAIQRLNALITDRMPAFYARLNEHGIRPDPGEAVPMPARP